MKNSFKLIFKDRTFQIPSTINRFDELSDEVKQTLIFHHNHQYHVKSCVNEDVFQAFIDYWVNKKTPDIQKDNFNQYFQLNQEFHLLNTIIQPKIEQWGDYFLHLNSLNNDYNQDLSYHEEEIAKNLDDYLQNYSTQLMNKPIQSLFNIFNHKKRNLTKYDLAYELIKNQYNESNDLNIFILLTTLDGTKISEENLNDSISMKDDRLGFTPTIKTSYLKKAIEKQEILEQQVNELMSMFKFINSKFDEEKEKTAEVLENHSIELAGMQDKFMNEIKSLNEIIENKEKEIDRITKILDKHGDDISTNDEKNSNEIVKLNEIIENQLKEIETMKDEYKNEVSSLKEIIENQNNEILTLKEVHNNEIVSLNESIKNHQNNITSIIKSILSENQENSNPLNFDNVDHFLFSNLSYKDPGILQQLKNEEKSLQDPLFIASQSSADVYNLIVPNTKDFFSLNSKDFFIEFKIPESITIIGFKVFSSNKFYHLTLKSKVKSSNQSKKLKN